MYTLICRISIITIDLSVNNIFLSSINEFGYIEVWDFKSTKLLIRQHVHNTVKDLCFSKKSYFLITSGWEEGNLDGTIKLWKIVGINSQLIKLF